MQEFLLFISKTHFKREHQNVKILRLNPVSFSIVDTNELNPRFQLPSRKSVSEALKGFIIKESDISKIFATTKQKFAMREPHIQILDILLLLHFIGLMNMTRIL